MKTRLDADKVEIVNIEEILTEYPLMPKELFDKITNRFAWDIGDEIVMAVEDLKFSLAYDKWEENNREDLDHEWNNRHKCSVCGEYILIDDELYQDEISNEPLCSTHAIMNEITGNYRAITDDELKKLYS